MTNNYRILIFFLILLGLKNSLCQSNSTNSTSDSSPKSTEEPIIKRDYNLKIGIALKNESTRKVDKSFQDCIGAIITAYHDCKSDGLMEKYNLSFVYEDNTEDGHAIYKLINIHKVDAILGLFDSEISIISAAYAGYMKTMLYSMASIDGFLGYKYYYSTLIRAGLPDFTYPAYSMTEILLYFNWTNVGLFMNVEAKDGMCQSANDVVQQYLRYNSRFKVVEKLYIDGNSSDKDIADVIKKFSTRVRIIIICMEEDQLRMTMRQLKKSGENINEYVFIYYTDLMTDFTLHPWGNTTSEEEMDIYAPLFQMTMSSALDTSFLKNLPKAASGPPFFNTLYLDNNWTPSMFSIFGHIVTYFMCQILNITATHNKDPHDVDFMKDLTVAKYYTGRFGIVEMDYYKDVVPDYTVWRYDNKDVFVKWIDIIKTKRNLKGSEIKEWVNITWNTVDGQPPRDIPLCGFFNENCPEIKKDITPIIASVTVSGIVLIIILAILGFFIRRKRMESILFQMIWKINMDDLKITEKRQFSMANLSMKSAISARSIKSAIGSTASIGSDLSNKQVFAKIAIYKGITVAMKTIDITNTKVNNISREKLLELKEMKEITHTNINSFIGMNLDPPEATILWMYCGKGSLQDIIENDDIKLDDLFKRSLICDIVDGMIFLQSTKLKFHGNLSSATCLIDSRWVLKVSSFGLHNLRNLDFQSKLNNIEENENQIFNSFLWTSPEILKQQCFTPGKEKELYLPKGSKEGDVYAFGMILSEILYRGLPFYTELLPSREIINKVINSNIRPKSPPDLEFDEDDVKYISVMEECWKNIEKQRPDFEKVGKLVKKIIGKKSKSIMDVMIEKLEKYANNLETIVASRTAELTEEKKKTDSLLHKMLPPSIAEKLKIGKTIEPEIFDLVTIFFSDVVGFTKLSSRSTPIQIVNLLNDMYTLFDDILAMYDVYKVETIGDAYMIVSGAPKRNGHRHAIEIANVSLHLSTHIKHFKVLHLPDEELKLRIGLHTGYCAAGVVGLTMPRYCLFGNTVTIANSMESNGMPMKVHISTETKKAIELAGGNYGIEYRGVVTIRGKEMETYWLERNNDVV